MRGRKRHLSPEAEAEVLRLLAPRIEAEVRRLPTAQVGKPVPSEREVARLLHAKGLTDRVVNSKLIWRTAQREIDRRQGKGAAA